MGNRTKVVIGASVLAVAAGIPAFAAGGDDAGEQDVPIIWTDLERASAAALDQLGQGRVSGTEVDDEESYYEVEVTLDDGTHVDVQLDEGFKVVGSESDGADDGVNGDD